MAIMANILNMFPNITTNDHPDHVATNTIFGCDNSVRPSRVVTDGRYLFSSKFVPAVSSFVQKLYTSVKCPNAIRRKVPTIVVYTLKSNLPFWTGWTWSHIGKKIYKSFWARPAFANRKTATSVVAIAGVARVAAASVYQVPNKVLWSLGHIISPEDGGSSGGRVLQHSSAAPLYSN